MVKNGGKMDEWANKGFSKSAFRIDGYSPILHNR